MINIACVLRTGGEYHSGHVRALKRGFEKHLTIPHRFVCLSDAPGDGYWTVPLCHNWKGWFSKIELFRPGLFFGPVFYADLDTIIVGNCDDIVLGHKFTVLENFWAASRIGSGLMAWDTNLREIYERFRVAPVKYMNECTTKENWGDQGFIRFNSPIEPERFQTKFPGRIVSYKFHCTESVPKDASIVCFHGKPRPWVTPLWQGDK